MAGTFSAWRLGTLQARALPLAMELTRHGLRCAIVTTPWDQPSEAGTVDVRGSVPVVSTNRTDLLSTPLAVRQQVATIRSLRARLVHVFKPKGYGGLAAAFLRERPLVVDSDDWEGDGGWNRLGRYSIAQRRLFDWQERTLLRDADTVTAASTLLARRARAMRATATSDTVRFVPNGLARDWARELAEARLRHEHVSLTPTATATTPTVLLYTRFAEIGADWLPRFAAGLSRCRPCARIVVVGDLPQEVARAIATAGRLPPLTLCGYLSRSELAEVLGSSTLAVFPYDDTLVTRTKQSVKLLEQMAAGCPLVATDRGDVARVLGQAGVVVPDSDPLRFAEVVGQLLAASAVRRRMSAAGPARIAEHFTIERIAVDLMRCYDSLGIASR
jgi:glycosyltransferase involved in cell wall biosynthesis